jgi:hypothetical protein
VIGQVLKVRFIAFDPPLAQVVPRTSAIQVPAATTKHSEQDIDKISIPREELEDVMLADLQVTVACADTREIAIFGAGGLRSGATWIVTTLRTSEMRIPIYSGRVFRDEAGRLATVGGPPSGAGQLIRQRKEPDRGIHHHLAIRREFKAYIKRAGIVRPAGIAQSHRALLGTWRYRLVSARDYGRGPDAR